MQTRIRDTFSIYLIFQLMPPVLFVIRKSAFGVTISSD